MNGGANRCDLVNARLVAEYVTKSIAERITVNDIARCMRLNASYLNTSFKRYTGECITVYIARCKAQRARELLEDGTLSLTDIWTALGYFDQSHFTRQFRRIYGCPPGEYRRHFFEKTEQKVKNIDEK